MIVRRVIGKLIRQQVDIDEMKFGLMPTCETTNTFFILGQLHDKNLHLLFVDFEKGFD